MNWVDTDFEIGTHFRKIREWQNLSRKDFSEMLKTSEPAYRNFEEGRVGVKVMDLMKYCKILNIDFIDILQKDFLEKNLMKYLLKERR